MTPDPSDLIPIAAELVGVGFSTTQPSPRHRETSRETSSPDRLDMHDAAPRCANTRGPLTPPEPVRTTELS